MKKFIKTVFTAITLILALAIVGCAGEDTTTTTEAVPTATTSATTTVATKIPSSLVGTYSAKLLDDTYDLGVFNENPNFDGLDCTMFLEMSVTLASDGMFSNVNTISNSYGEIPASLADYSNMLQYNYEKFEQFGSFEAFDGYFKVTLTKSKKTERIGAAAAKITTRAERIVGYGTYGDNYISIEGVRLYKNNLQPVEVIPGEYIQGGIVELETLNNVQYAKVLYKKLVVTSVSDVDLYSMSYYLKVGATDGKKYLKAQSINQMVETPTVEYESEMVVMSSVVSATGVFSFTINGGEIPAICYQHRDSIMVFYKGVAMDFIKADSFVDENLIIVPYVNEVTLDPSDVIIFTLNEDRTQVVSTPGTAETIIVASNDNVGLNVVYKVNDKVNLKNASNAFIYSARKNLALSTNEHVSGTGDSFYGLYTVVIIENDTYKFEFTENWSEDKDAIISLTILDSEGKVVGLRTVVQPRVTNYLEAGTYTFAVNGKFIDILGGNVDSFDFTFSVSPFE